MTERQKKLIQDLESLVHRRFNEKTLNAELCEDFYGCFENYGTEYEVNIVK